MKLRHCALAAILVLTFFTLSCKRDEYKAPDLSGPAVNDLYLLINVNPTVVPAGSSASVRVRLMGLRDPWRTLRSPLWWRMPPELPSTLGRL